MKIEKQDAHFFDDFDGLREFDLFMENLYDYSTEDCYNYKIFCDEDFQINIYQIDKNEEISFMECEGTSSECSCFIPKTTTQFFEESFDYMKESAISVHKNGDCIKIKSENKPFHKKTSVSYFCNENEETDLMKFTLYDQIVME